jgi:hypothetical protein
MSDRISTLSKRLVVAALVVWQFALTSLLLVAGTENAKLGALAKMAWGINFFWIVGFGLLSLYLRKRVARFGATIHRGLVSVFVGFVISFALIEEGIATAMTNCAPLFGVEMGEVYITASGNDMDVVLFHSVVVFVPQFLV